MNLIFNIFKKKLLYILLLLISFFIIALTYNNYFLYKTPILKITNIENSVYDTKTNESIKQKITGIIKNGKYKNNVLSFENETTKSGVYDEQLHDRSELLVSLSTDGNNILEIKEVKRDKYLVILLVIFMDLMIIIGKKKGVKSIIALFLNVLLAGTAIYLYINEILNINILLLFSFISIMFIVFSLIICNGFNKKTLCAILSSITTLIISFCLSFLVLNIYNDMIYYWHMDYIEVVRDYKGIFYTSVLLCGLGAIMDISITMASSLNEIIKKNNEITTQELKKSGQEISKDILGTMINVMLYTCYVSVIPIIFLAVRNNMTIANAISNYGQIEMIRILTSCISIVLAIPISLYVCLLIYKKANNK